METPRLLKKYSNRRLYDTHSSAYITLADAAGLIREGHTLKVVDAKTESDVTAFILTQVVMEEAKAKGMTLPTSLLHLFIRFGDTFLSDFFDRHLEKALQDYLSYRQAMEDQFSQYLDLGNDMADVAQKSIQQLFGIPPTAPTEKPSESPGKKD